MTAALALRSYFDTVTLEELYTAPHGFGLTTASPVQLAVCRIAEGRPLGELAEREDVQRALGRGFVADEAVTLAERPREITFLSGVRVAKSLFVACLAVFLALRADMAIVGPGEMPRVPILSFDLDKAAAVMRHLIGRLRASPLLRCMVVSDLDAAGALDGVVLRRPDGRHVEIKAVAGKRAGSAVVSTWCAGCIFDEFPRMVGASDAVVNYDETRDAVENRILDGGLIANVGSPYAPEGPAYAMVMNHWGRPSKALVVLKAPAWEVNPVWWTPERVAEQKARNPDAYVTDVAAEFGSADEALIPNRHTENAMRSAPEDLPPMKGADYAAAMDPATRGNGWTLVVATNDNGVLRVVLAREWIGSREEPLDPKMVLDEVKATLAPYGLTSIDTDQHMGDRLSALGEERGLALRQWKLSDADRTKRYLELRTRFATGTIELAPSVGDRLRLDMTRLRRRHTRAGITIELPLTSDGRHCDYAPALMLIAGRYLDDVVREPEPKGEDDLAREEATRMRERVNTRWGQREEWD